MCIVKVENVSMRFNLSRERVDNLKEFLIRKLKNNLSIDEFWALKNINLEIKKGESLGLVGLNGSGKSTLLKIIAGVMKPTSGCVEIHGSVAPLIELGAGFDMDLSARENIFLNGAILGYTRQKMESKLDDIIEFSELGEFIDVPVKNFSSGMLARLGFSIATISKPEILIVDEILSVGDYKFQEKCEARIAEMIEAGTTIILVSHSMEQVKKVCKKAVLLKKGSVIAYGTVDEIYERYTHDE